MSLAYHVDVVFSSTSYSSSMSKIRKRMVLSLHAKLFNKNAYVGYFFMQLIELYF